MPTMDQTTSDKVANGNASLREWTDSAPIDTTYEVVSPENVSFKFRIAGPFIRTWAYAIDVFLIGLYLVVTSFGVAYAFSFFSQLFNVSERLSSQFLLAFLFLNFMFAFWFITPLFEALWHGRTPGKALLSLRVLTTSGRPIGFGQAMLRNILRLADLIIGAFGAIVMGTNERMARIGDLASGTMVVLEERRAKKNATVHEQTTLINNLQAKIPDDFVFTPELRDALALYVARRNDISPARRYEIAVSLADALSQKARFPYRVEPDAFLCALYRFSLGAERRAG